MPEQWGTRRLEFCLDRWENDDDPDHETRVAVYEWLMNLREEPRPPSAAPVVSSTLDMWLAEVPGTVVNVLYVFDDDKHVITFWTIDTL